MTVTSGTPRGPTTAEDRHLWKTGGLLAIVKKADAVTLAKEGVHVTKGGFQATVPVRLYFSVSTDRVKMSQFCDMKDSTFQEGNYVIKRICFKANVLRDFQNKDLPRGNTKPSHVVLLNYRYENLRSRAPAP